MEYLLLICAEEDADAASEDVPGEGVAERGGLEVVSADAAQDPAVRFGSVDVRPVWWREAA